MLWVALTIPISGLLLAAQPSVPSQTVSPAALRGAVQRSLPLMQSSADTWLKRRDCSSCHHQGLGLLTVAVARERGFAVDEKLVRVQMSRTLKPPSSWLERAALAEMSINETIGQSYRALGVGAGGGTATPVTEAIVHLLAGKQHVSGAWPSASHRPPHEDSNFTATATTIRTLRLFPVAKRKLEIDARIDRARRWLENARPVSTEDRAMQLLGLAWSGAPASALRHLAAALLQEQRADGGWAQIQTRSSDPYATGQVLVALNQAARLPPADAAWQRGVSYLLASQQPDGSWRVRTRRTVGGLPYFESGYPHGEDQFISYAGAAWATLALMLADHDSLSPAIAGQPEPREPATADVPESEGLTPLMLAAFDGTMADLDRALATTPDVNAASPLGLTALMFASHDPQKVERLLGAGARADLTTRAGHTALLLAAGYDGAFESVDLLLRKGGPIDVAPTRGMLAGLAPLARAAMRGDTRVADRLLRAGARIGGAPEGPVPAVHVAAWIGDADMVHWLARRGADVSIIGPEGAATALMAASEDGQAEVIHALLANGASVDAVNAEGFSALQLASQAPDRGDTRIIDLLLEAGADPARTTPDGQTAAELAERWGKTHLVARLRPRQ